MGIGSVMMVRALAVVRTADRAQKAQAAAFILAEIVVFCPYGDREPRTRPPARRLVAVTARSRPRSCASSRTICDLARHCALASSCSSNCSDSPSRSGRSLMDLFANLATVSGPRSRPSIWVCLFGD